MELTREEEKKRKKNGREMILCSAVGEAQRKSHVLIGRPRRWQLVSHLGIYTSRAGVVVYKIVESRDAPGNGEAPFKQRLSRGQSRVSNLSPHLCAKNAGAA